MFGTTQQTPSLFGTQARPPPPAFHGFGTPSTSAPQSSFNFTGSQTGGISTGSMFGTTQQTPSLFGTQARPAASTFPGFGTPASSAPQTGFNFTGSQAQSGGISTGSMFGTAQPAPSLFGTQARPAAPAFSGFGTPASSAPQTSFNFTGSQTAGMGSFFSNLQKSAQSVFGSITSNQQQVQPQQVDQNQAFYQSIFQCNKFGDERDTILANFNYLQACMGTGKGYYSQIHPPVIYTPSNPFFRCKAVGYEFIYTNSNEDGQVAFDMKKSHEKIRTEESQFILTLQQLLGRQNIFFKISGIKATSEEQCVVNIYAEDQGTLRRIPATDLANAFLHPNFKAQLDTWGVTNISAKVRPSPEQLRRYIETAPEGIDPRVWKQAQEDNPDPENMIPAPIIGIDALRKRIHIQETESEHHNSRLNIIEEECAQVQTRHSVVTSELLQMKRKQAQLSHRLLSVIVRQEIIRKAGTTVSASEEDLEKRIESLDEKLNSPTEFKGRLKELLSQIRLHQYSGPSLKYTIDEASLYQIKDVLETQQEGIKHLVETVKNDLENLQGIAESVTEAINSSKAKSS